MPQNGGLSASDKAAGIKNFNQSAYETLENEIADWIGHDMEVEITIDLLDYAKGRPGQFAFRYEVYDRRNGANVRVHRDDALFVNAAGQVFDRFKRADISAKIREKIVQ